MLALRVPTGHSRFCGVEVYRVNPDGSRTLTEKTQCAACAAKDERNKPMTTATRRRASQDGDPGHRKPPPHDTESHWMALVAAATKDMRRNEPEAAAILRYVLTTAEGKSLYQAYLGAPPVDSAADAKNDDNHLSGLLKARPTPATEALLKAVPAQQGGSRLAAQATAIVSSPVLAQVYTAARDSDRAAAVVESRQALGALEGQLETKARGLMASEGIGSFAVAMAKAAEANPALYREIVAARQRAGR